MKRITTCGRCALIWAVLALLGMGSFTAQAAWPELPTHKTYVVPGYFPKNGQGDYSTSGFDIGEVRNTMENIYEGWWREYTYYRASPTNGANIRGYFMDTKTVGEVALPWAWNPGLTQMGETNVVGLVLGTAVADVSTNYTGIMDPVPVKGRPLTIQIGTRTLSDTLGSGSLAGDGVGTINHGTGAYSFHLNVAAPEGTPIEAYYTAYVEGAAPSPGAWGNFSAIIGDTGEGRFPDGRGEHFDELADEDTPAVRYRRREGDTLVDAPLVDGFWTPGERFTDLPGPGGLTAPNGNWDPYTHAEDTWTPVHTNGGIWADDYFETLRDYVDPPSGEPLRGDFFYDYDFSITAVSSNDPVRVVTTTGAGMASRNVQLRIADTTLGWNFSFNISEFDLTPPLIASGDFSFELIDLSDEDQWTPVRTLGSLAPSIYGPDFEAFLQDSDVGDVIADYNYSIVPGSGGTTVPEASLTVSSNVTVYIADTGGGTNIPYVINELDLTPPRYYGTGVIFSAWTTNYDDFGSVTVDPDGLLEGDAGHTYVWGGDTNAPVYTNVASMSGRFEYERLDGNLAAVRETSGDVEIWQYLNPGISIPLINNPGLTNNGMVCISNAFEHYIAVTDMNEAQPILSNPLNFSFTIPLLDAYRVPLKVNIPLYYAEPVWGEPVSTNLPNHFTNTVAGGAPVLNPFVDAVGNDDQWTAGGTITNLDLGSREIRYTPNGSVTSDVPLLLEGDAAWTYVRDTTAPPVNLNPLYGDVGALERLEYNDDDGLPHVYRAPFEVILSTYVDLSQELYDSIQANPGEEFSGYIETNGAIHAFAPEPDFFFHNAATGPLPDASPLVRTVVLVHVPLYYSLPIWGEPADAATYQDPAPEGVPNPFLDSLGEDDAPTPEVEEEPYSDFISWWDPNGGEDNLGDWVPGVYGSPRGTLPPESEATPEYWSYSEYTDYIANNYPGDAAGLIARCGDTVYDGPENWAEVDNNQYIQTAWIAGLVSVNMFEDYTVGPDDSLADWWANRYGTPVATEMVGQIPFVSEWKPELTDDNQVQPVTTVTNETEFGTEVVTTYDSMTHPPEGTTWTYDSPREFDDLASSLYHNPELGSLSALSMREPLWDSNPLACWDGGDLRLGEPTSPWPGGNIYGHDRGDSLPGTRDVDGGDGEVPLAGPYAYNTHANFGHDGANQLSLEFSTHRTDGESLTTGIDPDTGVARPLGGHRKWFGYDFNYAVYNTWEDSVPYARDHRDVNLNGLIDQGETIPDGSQNYFADPAGEDGGMDTMALFGWERCTEDYIDTYDAIEDFRAIVNFTFPGGTGEEWGILTPGWFAWEAGQAATDTLANELGGLVLYADTDESGDFTPHVDAIWVDTTTNGVYDDLEVVIHDRYGMAGSETLSGFGPATALFADIGNSNGVYDLGQDLVWLDDGATAGIFDSELVLSDLFGQLEPGDGDAGLLNLRTTNSIYAYPSATNFSMIWAVTNGYAGATEEYGSTNGFDLIYLGPGFTPSVGSTTGLLWNAVTDGEIRYVSFGDADLGYLPGLAVFIDDPASTNGLYDGDTAISVPGNSLDPSYAGVASNGTFEVAYTTNAASPGFDRTMSVAWIETSIPSNERSGEFVVFESFPLVNGTTNFGDISANIQWVDLPGTNGSLNGTFDPIVWIEGLGGEGAPLALGDGVFYDYNANGIFNYGATTRIPLYMVGLMNPLGLSQAGVLHSGNFYGTMTRDGYISGFNQNQSVAANMPVPALLTHEQGHDTPGWPDLYDYDVSTEEVDNLAASGDLYSDAGLVHGYPDLKFYTNPYGAAFPGTRGVTPQELNFTPNAILTRDSGPQTLLLYPVERYSDQYYVFRDETNPYEYFTINYNAGNLSNTDNPLGELPSPYAGPFGRGVIIGHSDYTGSKFGAPQQQRSNNRFTWLFVQADGKYELEDGVNGAEPADAFGTTNTTRQFTQSTIPRAEWYDKDDSGLRILDIRIPSEPYGPCEIDIEWSSPLGGTNSGDGTDWYWVSSGNDSDGDGIPDAWEYYWFGRHASPLAEASQFTDFDGDGLSDYGEWLAHANPTWVSSWSGDRNPQNLSDADIDLDGDGLSNLAEVEIWHTRPRDIDSDDDGYTDGEELDWDVVKADGRHFTSPTYSRSPLTERALRLSPTNSYLLPESSIGLQYEREPISDFDRLRLTNWTVEAWVYLDSTNESGSVVWRETLQGAVTFNLGITNNLPVASISTVAGLTYSVVGLESIASSNWTHIAGALDRDDNSLRVFVNGALAGTQLVQGNDPGHPGYIGGLTTSGETWLGGDGLNGIVDEVRIWSRARSEDEIDYGYEKIVNSPWKVFDPAELVTNIVATTEGDGVTNFATNVTFRIDSFETVINDGSLVVNLRFDDGQNLTNRLDYGNRAFGAEDWVHPNNWHYAVMGMDSSDFVTNAAELVLSQSIYEPIDDLNEDAIPDWWQTIYWPGFDPSTTGVWDAAVDADGDGLINRYEYYLGTTPLDADTDGNNIPDALEDFDNDGLSNGDEQDIFGSDPGDPDTDDDGYDDGDEVMGWEPAGTNDYGIAAMVSSPVESISPHVRRSYVAAGRSLDAPHSERFAFRGIEEVVVPGPTVEITAPDDGADIDVRFTDVAATITQVGAPIASVLLYINDQFMADYGAASSFNDTVIINSGENIITVYGIDTEGNLGSDTITINGSFAPADIRVTQTWSSPGDLDTWLIDPLGRNMGFAPGANLVIGPPDQPGEAIPGAFLDIDDIPGTGPENITLEEPNSIEGEYEVWMNNYSHSGNPESTVRVLVNEGRPGESYVEFGPQSMPNTGIGNPDAWWHVTTITMPEGTMDPPGTPILPPDDIAAPDVGVTAENGWTMECWVKPGDDAQSGAIAAYRDPYGNEPFVIGLTNNMPFVKLRSSSGTSYQAMGGAIDEDVWTHLAFVYSSTDHTLRVHINGLLAAAQVVLESRDDSVGTLYVDTELTGGPDPLTFTDIHLDELRIWKVARNGGLIAAQMHEIQSPKDTIVAMYRFDDGGTDIEDGRYPLNTTYDLGQGAIPDTAFNTKPGPDGDRYTTDDVGAGAVPDGENDYVTSMEYAPVMGILDADADGIADWYEALFGAPAVADDAGGLVPGEDLDADGLLNLFEYHARTNPDDEDSDGDGLIDPEEDIDGDGLSNIDEQIHATDPWLVDTDDDGFGDDVETRYGSAPTNALDPAYMRALHVTGAASNCVEMPPALRLALSDWTVSAKVYLETPVTAGSIIAREVQSGEYNYRLGIGTDRIPYIEFTAADGSTVMLSAPELRALPVEEWIMLSASFHTLTGDLTLSIEGELVAQLPTEARPKTSGLGPVHGTVGSGFNGYIDDVMIMDGAGGTQLHYSFDDSTHADGVSGEVDFRRGQVQEMAPVEGVAHNWMLEWRDAGTLAGSATIELYPGAGAQDDADGDGLPDWWEIANGLNPFDSDTDGDGIPDGSEDGDLDGLVNWTEYRAGTDPDDPDSDDNGTLDKDEDPDGDGLVNFDEQLNATRPDLPDTDDDGLSDNVEVSGPVYTLPIASLSPSVPRALELTSGTQTLVLPDEARFRLANAWTIEAWVWMDDTAFVGGNVLSRSVGDSVNYHLGIEADGTPYVRAVGVYDGTLHPYVAADAVPMARRGDWYHLAGVWTRSSSDMQLYVNGELRAVESMPDVPGIFSATGAVSTVVGGDGFVGRIDEVRIWNVGRSALELRDGAYDVQNASEANLVAYYRFDDGTHASGTSGTNVWTFGQVEDFAIANKNWDLSWTNAATLAGGATVTTNTTPMPDAVFADYDGDELPDFWESAIFGSVENGMPASDVDSDGLSTLFEYRASMHPLRQSTFDDEIEDGLRDPDGDGLINQEEVVKFTLPGDPDTDDDGLTDREELTVEDDPSTTLVPDRRSNPRRSMDPPRPRSLAFDGDSRAVVHPDPEHSLSAWTIEAWVRPAAGADGIVLRRATEDLPGMRGINYELGVENRGGTLYAYTQYTTDYTNNPQTVRIDTAQPEEITTNDFLTGSMILPEQWTHLAATYQPTNFTYKLYVDGVLASYRIDAVAAPALGAGEDAAVGSEFTLGGGSLLAGAVQDGFNGHIDEVRVMRGALSDETIQQHAAGFGQFYGLVHAVDTSGTAAIQTLPPVIATTYDHVPGEMLVRFKSGVSSTIQSNTIASLGLETLHKGKIVPVSRLRFTDGTALKNKLAEVQANPNVLYAEPNYTRTVGATPDDPLLAQLWGMHNTGQNGGTDDADIDAPEAWDRVTGSDQVIVAVIDTGVNYNHADLAANMWINAGETAGNGVDDDGNGFVDDVYGYDFINSDADPIDDHDHGSHCAGTIGGVGNNGIGVVGVNWNVRIMALKAFSAQGGGSSGDIIAAIDYAVLMGAHVSNNSYGGTGSSQAEYDAIEAARNAGHLFVAAAGNDGTDNDTIPQYPASFDLDNIIAVAATDRNDGLAGFSCFGLESVDIGAPGVDIHSTLSGGGYGNMSGTSMATPHTAGAAALILAANSQLTYDQVRQLILNGVDLIPSLDGKVATGGRLNVFNALPEDVVPPQPPGDTNAVPLDVVAYFTCDDAGEHAEDFSVAGDYYKGWNRAARLEGATFDASEVFDNIIDSDGDGMPDWWEIAMGMDPYDATGDNGRDADLDEDGLTAIYEYWSGTDPREPDTNFDGENDGSEDADGDTLSNLSEQDDYQTNPAKKDTDDDGTDDNDELDAATQPTDSLSPYISRALEFAGGSGADNTVVVAGKIDGVARSELDLSVWTVECWVNPTVDDGGTYPLLSRGVKSDGRMNYEIGLSNLYPYVAFDQSEHGSRVIVMSGTPVATGEWAHVAGRFDEDGELTLFVDGDTANQTQTIGACALGEGNVVLGSSGFAGRLMLCRIWRIAQDDAIIGDLGRHTIFFGSVSELAGYLQVSGDGFLKENAVTEGNAGLIDQLTDEWTLETWVRVTSDGMVMAHRNGSAATDEDFNYYLGVEGGSLIGRFALWYDLWLIGELGPYFAGTFYDYEANNIYGELDVADGEWHHVAYVRNANSCALYVDGILDAVQDLFLLPDLDEGFITDYGVRTLQGPLIIGEGLSGDIDEARLWERGLLADELLDVSDENLGGDERGLISYFNFDYQLTDLADERSVRRNPEEEYGLFIGDAVRANDQNDGPPIVYDPLLTFMRVAMVAYFAGVDGGDTVEDYMNRMGRDPFTFEKFAGVRGTGVVSVALTAPGWPETPDSDNDSLPDGWESMHGLNPGASGGDDGKWGDPDKDGLHNFAEYQVELNHSPIASDPLVRDTDVDGFADFFEWDNLTYRIFGELYTDFDSMEDEWEDSHELDPLHYDAHRDFDDDGWSNLAEFMADTAANAMSDYPVPNAEFEVLYSGQKSGDLVIMTYTDAGMDGTPDAVFEVLEADLTFPLSGVLSNLTSGYLHEGPTWFFAFLDGDGNDEWDVGEPAAVAEAQPITVDWSQAGPVTIGLVDQLAGYERISWSAVGGYDSYQVAVYDWNLPGPPLAFPVQTIAAPRTWFHEGDYRAASVTGLQHGVYEWVVSVDDGGSGILVGSSYFNVLLDAAATTPSSLLPQGDVWNYSRNEMRWTMADDVTQVEIEVDDDPLFGSPLPGLPTFVAPYRRSGGECRYTLPIYAGDGVFTNGSYFWRVRAINPRTTSDWAEGSLIVDLDESGGGPFSIGGDLGYFGKVTNGSFVVQAHTSPGFGGVPDAQVTLTNTSNAANWPYNEHPFELRGLRAGTYYVRGFLDQDVDGERDSWEAAGFVQATAYSPDSLILPVSRTGERLPVWLADTDNDRIADDWEIQYMGDLVTMGPGPVDEYTDFNGDLVSDYDHYASTPMNSSPIDLNAAGPDGIPFWVKTAFAIDPFEYYAFLVTTVGVDENGDNVVRWPAPQGSGIQMLENGTAQVQNSGVTLEYQLQYSENLLTWTDLAGDAPVTYDPVSGEFEVRDGAHMNRVGFYRVLMSCTR
ncbi:MAG: S8 family serine peptidase [Kiritimatiellia bacterium]|nr:S8 family serine peptidase [Kiritimatiellia bacterium]